MHVVEGQLRGVLGVLADLLEVAAALEALHAALEDEQRDPAVALGRVRLHGRDHEVRVDAVGDEGLGAVDDVVAVLAAGGRGHPREVRADARLGHRDRGDQLAGDDAWKPALALLRGAVAQEVGQADVVVERDPETEAGDALALALFADHHVQPEVLGARAAVGLGDGHREEAAAPGRRVQLARDDALALPVHVVRDHLPLEERAEARPEVFVKVLVERASHGAGPYTGSGSARKSGLASSSCTSRIRRSAKPPSHQQRYSSQSRLKRSS